MVQSIAELKVPMEQITNQIEEEERQKTIGGQS
jgi:hypothetical protein